jgi:hypothetical protein
MVDSDVFLVGVPHTITMYVRSVTHDNVLTVVNRGGVGMIKDGNRDKASGT